MSKYYTPKLRDAFGGAAECAVDDIRKYVEAMGRVEAAIEETLPNDDALGIDLFDAQQAVIKIIGHIVQCGIDAACNNELVANAARINNDKEK